VRVHERTPTPFHSIYHRVATSAVWRTFRHEGKISPDCWGWGVHAQSPTPFHHITITSKVAVYAPAEREDTRISSLPLCTQWTRLVTLTESVSAMKTWLSRECYRFSSAFRKSKHGLYNMIQSKVGNHNTLPNSTEACAFLREKKLSPWRTHSKNRVQAAHTKLRMDKENYLFLYNGNRQNV
jgi:hypothetical protein